MDRWVSHEQKQRLAAFAALPDYYSRISSHPSLAPIMSNPLFAPAIEQLRREGVAAFSGPFGPFLSDFAIQVTELAPLVFSAPLAGQASASGPSFEDVQAQVCAAAKSGNLAALHAIFDTDTADPVLLFGHDREGFTAVRTPTRCLRLAHSHHDRPLTLTAALQLHCAAQGGFSEIVSYLLSKGLDPNIRVRWRLPGLSLFCISRISRISWCRLPTERHRSMSLLVLILSM